MQQHVQLLLPPPLSLPLAIWEIVGHKLTSFRFVSGAPEGNAAAKLEEFNELVATGRDGSHLRDAYLEKSNMIGRLADTPS